MKKALALLFLISVTALADMQNTPHVPDVNDYNQLPCPTDEQFQELTQKIHLEKIPDGALCDDSKKAHLAKLLFLMDQLGIANPPFSTGLIARPLKNPFEYLATMNKKVTLDLTQTTSDAYNEDKVIYLGTTVFTDDPLASVSTLVHESRHSDPKDPDHVRCTHGDIPLSDGGCDLKLALDESASGYGFETAYDFSLAKLSEILSDSDRRYLRSMALGLLGTRFNEIPSAMGVPYDSLAALDESGKIWWVQPFTHDLIDSTISVSGEKIIRIEHNDNNDGLMLFTDQKHVFTWNAANITAPWIPGNIAPADFKVVDANLLNTGDDTFSFILDDQNKLWKVDTDPQTGNPILVAAKIQPAAFQGSRILRGGINENYFSDSNGALHLFKKGETILSEFQALGGWIQNSTGILNDLLYGLNLRGDLYYLPTHDTGSGKKSRFIVESSKKYVEATDFRAQLDAQGAISVSAYGDTATPNLFNPSANIKDIAVMRRWVAGEQFMEPPAPTEAQAQSFAAKCGATSITMDPWLARLQGIDAQHHIIFEGDESHPCLELKGPEGVESFALKSTSGATPTRESTDFAQPFLELNAAGGLIELKSYR